MAPRARAPGQPTQPIRSEGEGLRGSARVRSLVRSFTRGGCSRETILLKHPPQPGPRDHRTRFCIQCTHAQNAASPPPRTTGVRVQLSSPPTTSRPIPPKPRRVRCQGPQVEWTLGGSQRVRFLTPKLSPCHSQRAETPTLTPESVHTVPTGAECRIKTPLFAMAPRG